MRFHLAGLVVLMACGTSTSTPSDGGGNADASPYTLASLDDTCDGTVTGRQLMALVRPSYAGTWMPPGSRPTGMTWTGTKTPSPVSIGVSHGTGAITCHPKPVYNCPPGAPCAAPQPAYVTVDLDFTFKTSDGTLDEKLVVTARYEPNIQSSSFTGDLAATAIKGTYPIAAGTPQETRLTFNGTFEGGGCNGGISELTSKISFSAGSWMAKEAVVDGGSDASTD